MKVVTKYISILGREFDNPADAIADEDRLPSIIATYERDLAKQVVGGSYGKNKILTEEMVAEDRPMFQQALDDYKAKWAEVQAQRAKS